MSTISTATYVEALHDWQVRVVPLTRGGLAWTEHGRCPNHAYAPLGDKRGILNHDTVTGTWPVDRALDLLWDGRPGIPGPLCHAALGYDGTVYLLGWGNVHHAGRGSSGVLAKLTAGDVPMHRLLSPWRNDTDGTPYLYGLECMNAGLGGGQDYTDAQLTAMARYNAAVCQAHGWGPASVLNHKEWTNRKVDVWWDRDGAVRRLTTARQALGKDDDMDRIRIPSNSAMAYWSDKDTATPEFALMQIWYEAAEAKKRATSAPRRVWNIDMIPNGDVGAENNGKWRAKNALKYLLNRAGK